MIQAASGVSGLLQQATGTAEYLPIALCDKVSGMTMVYAILAALLHREKTGKGQLVETPMFEASVAFNLLEHVCGYVFDPPLGEFGWSRMLSPSRHPFRTKDGFACIMPYTDRNWSDFFAAIGRPELSDDPRFARHALRIQNIHILYGIIEAHAPERTNREWIELCDRLSIPCMPVIPPTELWDDPHIRATGLLGLAEHPTEGRYRTIGSPVTFSETPTSIRKHAPNLGEDTVSVMRAAGLSEDEIELLLARRVLRQFKAEPRRSRHGRRRPVRDERIMTGTVRLTVDGAVATIVLSDPPTRNSLSFPMIAELTRLVRELNGDIAVKCLILTGEGDAFSSGANVKEMRDRAGFSAGSPLEIKQRLADSVQAMALALHALEIPTIAAVGGPAYGAGFDLALLCDLRIAATNAVFAETFLKLGVVSGDGGAWLLPRILGPQLAAYLTYTAEPISAAEAERIGLVLKVVEPAALAAEARALADRIANKPAHSLRAAKRLLRQSLEGGTLATHLELAANMHGVLQHTEDQKEAVAAFFEKRPPNFVNR